MLTKSWTKNADQIKKIEETLHAPIFADARWLAVQYLTRPEIVREVLPPPLEPLLAWYRWSFRPAPSKTSSR